MPTSLPQKKRELRWNGVRWNPSSQTSALRAYHPKHPTPHAALLFLDFLHSKEGQQLMMKGGLWSPREDIGTVDQKFKKNYLDEKYSLEEMEVKYTQWENLMRQLFIKKR